MEFGVIHHVAFNVADYQLEKDFYVNKLGFQVLGEYVFPSGTQRLDCQRGDARLEIFQTAKADMWPPVPHLGYRHLCFRTENILEAVTELKALGVEVEQIREDPMAGGQMTFFYDPEGLQLELHE